MPPNPGATSRRLVAAAEQLFAERGIDGVSLREINTAA
ncbi:TetR family transcriptional regulator [Streptosporangium lutulentum]